MASYPAGKSRVVTYYCTVTSESVNHTSYIKNLNLKCSFASRATTVTSKVVRRERGLICLMYNQKSSITCTKSVSQICLYSPAHSAAVSELCWWPAVAQLSIRLQRFWSVPPALSLPRCQVEGQQSSAHSKVTYALVNGAESSQKEQTKQIGCWKLYKFVSV